MNRDRKHTAAMGTHESTIFIILLINFAFCASEEQQPQYRCMLLVGVNEMYDRERQSDRERQEKRFDSGTILPTYNT